jgi:hypothetical protein
MLKNVTLAIDGTDIDSVSNANGLTSPISFTSLNETLKEGKHTFTLKANVNAGTDTASSKIVINNVQLNGGKLNTLNVSKLVANSYPTISSSTSSNDLILKIENPKDSEDDIEILGFLVDGDVVNASIKDSSITLANGSLKSLITAKNVSIAAGENVEFRIQAAKSATVQVKGIIIREDGQTLVIDSNYTNVGKWSSFKVTASGDQLPAKYFTLTSSDSDTTIAAKGTDYVVSNAAATNSWDATNSKFVTTITATVANNST